MQHQRRFLSMLRAATVVTHRAVFQRFQGSLGKHSAPDLDSGISISPRMVEDMVSGKAQNAIGVVKHLSAESRTVLLECLRHEMERDEDEESSFRRGSRLFHSADLNNDGVLTKEEFLQWYSRSLLRGEQEDGDQSGRPSAQQLYALSLRIALPFVGFGFLDNFIMITAGNTIENSIGLTLGLSTMAAAGLGNTISDVAGIGLGNTIEAAAGKLGLPNPNLTREQKKHSLSTVVRNVASVVGIALGCILGMLPLLFVDEEKKQLRALFDSIDVNGDGTISQTELRACLKGLGLEVGEEELQRVFQIADIDEDQSISFEEFCQLIQRWKLHKSSLS